MTDRVAKAQAIAAKWSDTIRRLREEIPARRAKLEKAKADALATRDKGKLIAGSFNAWDRHAQALARAVGALARAEHHAPGAAARVVKSRRLAAKAERHASDVAAFSVRLDQVAAAAPAVMARWARERKEEPKRIDKRRKQLARRITKDSRSGGGDESRAFFGTGRRRAASPMPAEAETFPSGPIIPYLPQVIEIDRPGLMAGDYRLVNQSPDDFDAYRVPKKWTAAYVGKRLADAHATLRRLPMTTRPKEFGTIWPEYTYASGELAGQAGAGTLTLGRNRIIGGTSAADVARMHEALAWPMMFLSASPVYARAVNDWAYDAAEEGMVIGPFAGAALEKIAKHLNAKKVEVT